MSDSVVWQQTRFAEGALKRLRTLAGAYPAQLESYLRHTFARLVEQDRVVYAHDVEGDFAVLNTGLTDALYEPIYCLCVPQDAERADRGWVTQAFCTWARTRYGKRIACSLGKRLPRRATYFDDGASVVAHAPETVDADYGELVAELKSCVPDVVQMLGMADDEALELALRNAMRVAMARMRYLPTCAVPAWGSPVDVEGGFFCLPLSLGDYQRADVIGVLQEHVLRKLISPAQADLCAWLVRMPDAGMAWVRDLKGAGVTEGPSIAQVDVSVSKARIDDDVRARLTCMDSSVPAYVVHSGDAVGISRRRKGAHPNIVLPSRRGFEGVSQIQGTFVAHDGEAWEFVHKGSNWTLVRHVDGADVVLRRHGSSERVRYGDVLIFSGSPSFVFGR